MNRARRLPNVSFVLPFLLLAGLACSSCASVQTASLPAETRIVIFHVNDIHGKIDNFAKVAAIIDAEKKSGHEVFYFCAGDNFTGNPVIDQYSPPGEPMLELLNRLGLDLLCPGNHEFDYGLKNLDQFAARALFSLVSANINDPAGLLPKLRPAVSLNTGTGLKVAVFGLTQVEPGNGLPSTHPDKVKGLSFTEPLLKALEMKKLRAGSDVLIALTHIGYDQDLLLAKAMPELDVIIGGHSHTRVEPAEMANGVLIAQAGSDNKYLGRIDLLIRGGRVVEKKGTLIDLKGPLTEVADVKEMIGRFNQNPAFARVLVEAPYAIEGKDALGCLMTDAMRAVHGLDIAFQNEGGIRTNRLPEKITLKDIFTLDPFGNQVVEIVMNVDEIRSLISDSFKRGGEIDLQVSGIAYTVRTVGKGTIGEIELRGPDGRPLPADRSYKVGLSSYVVSSYNFTHQDPGRALNATTAEALIAFLDQSPDLAVYRGIQRAFQDPPRGDRRY